MGLKPNAAVLHTEGKLKLAQPDPTDPLYKIHGAQEGAAHDATEQLFNLEAARQ